MRTMLISAIAAATLAGCATEPVQVARAECKVAPLASAAYPKGREVSSLDRAQALMHLRTSQFYRDSVTRHPTGLVAQIDHDCLVNAD